MSQLVAGAPAPDFTLLTADGTSVTLSALHGQRVIVYFYPAAMTPGCTTQACDFRDNWALLQAAGYIVLGISPDQQAKLANFAAKEQLPFTLLSDSDHTVARQWGAWGEKKMYGKTSVGLIRSTFVLDETGTVILTKYHVKATGHVAGLIRDLGIGESN